MMRIVAVVGMMAVASGTTAEGPAVEADRWRAGRDVRMVQEVHGDLMVAGYDIVISGPVRDDVWASGMNVTLKADVGDDLRAAGGTVRVFGRVGSDAHLAGSEVYLEAESRVRGDASLAGSDVRHFGEIVGDLRAAGRRVMLNGVVRGDVEVKGRQVELGPKCWILGDLRHASGTLDRHEQARVDGETIQAALTGGRARSVSPWLVLGRRVLKLFWFALAGGLLLWGLPGHVEGTRKTMGARPGWSLLSGFLFLVGVPVGAVLLILTFLGMPLGVILLGAFGLVWFLSKPVAAYALGRWILDRGKAPLRGRGRAGPALPRGAAGALLLGLLVWLGLNYLPFLGGAATTVLTLWTTGALVLTRWEMLRKTRSKGLL